MKTFVCRTMLVLLAVTVQINFGYSQETNASLGNGKYGSQGLYDEWVDAERLRKASKD